MEQTKRRRVESKEIKANSIEFNNIDLDKDKVKQLYKKQSKQEYNNNLVDLLEFNLRNVVNEIDTSILPLEAEFRLSNLFFDIIISEDKKIHLTIFEKITSEKQLYIKYYLPKNKSLSFSENNFIETIRNTLNELGVLVDVKENKKILKEEGVSKTLLDELAVVTVEVLPRFDNIDFEDTVVLNRNYKNDEIIKFMKFIRNKNK